MDKFQSRTIQNIKTVLKKNNRSRSTRREKENGGRKDDCTKRTNWENLQRKTEHIKNFPNENSRKTKAIKRMKRKKE